MLHLRWMVDAARPWAGVSPLSHAVDTGSLAGWLERRLSPKKHPGRSDSFLPVAKYDADPDADLDDDADDPLAAAQARHWVGAKGQVLGGRKSQMAAADSPASAPRKDFQVAAIRRESATTILMELRQQVTHGTLAAACGDAKRRVTRFSTASRPSGARSLAAIYLDIG